MMRDYVDTGRRCDRHVGEIFPPRCYDCDTASAATIYAPLNKWGECTKHPGYPAPCHRCKEDSE